MKRIFVFFGLYAKRLLKKPSFIIILMLMPAVVFILSNIINDTDDTISVGLYYDGESQEIKDSIEELITGDSAVEFIVAKSPEDIREAILRNEMECGFIFSGNIYENLVKEDADGGIILYESAKSTVTDYIKEKVFASIYRRLSFDRLVSYLDESEYIRLDKEERDAYLRNRYESYVDEGGIFEVNYTDGDTMIHSNTAERVNDRSYLKRPIKGFLSIFVMVASLAGAVFFAIDEKAGIYGILSYIERPFVNLVTIFIPTFLACAAAYVCVLISGVGYGALTELANIVSYCLLLTGFVNLLRAVISNEVVLCSLLPMLTVVCIICCDIIVNTAFYFTPVEIVRYFLPPHYFVTVLKNAGGIYKTAGMGIILLAAGVLTDRKKYMY